MSLNGYALAASTVILGFLVRWSLDGILHDSFPFGFFLIPVVITAYRTSMGPSLLAAGLGLISGFWFFVEPRYRFAAPDGLGWVLIAAYVLTSLLVCWHLEATRRTREKLKESAVQTTRLQEELEEQIAKEERTAAALQESEQRRRALLESIPHQVWTASPDGLCDYVSRQWEDYTGASAEEALANGWLERIHPDDIAGAQAHWEAVVKGEVAQDCEFRIRGRDGSYRWFKSRAMALRGPSGAIIKWFGTCTDIQATVEAREAMTQTQEELERAVRERTDEVERLKRKLEHENYYLREKISLSQRNYRLVGQSDAIRKVLTQAEQVARTDATVLLLGETGTGKELLAATLHELSARRAATLISVNCAAMPAPLVESELFGREKGAFTGSLSRQIGRFELANDSTIFLDEVGELSPEVQGKLLRVLETKQFERLGNPKPITVNVRVVAATNRDLETEVREGRFRQDLFYRLNVFPIKMPPLRERREDIPLLVWAFVDEFAKLFNKNIQSIDKESMDALGRYAWPGNVRELRNLIERAMIIATGPKLRIQVPSGATALNSASPRKLEEVERQHILGVLEKSGWRIRGSNGAAVQLGIKPTTLEARMARLGIRRPSTMTEV